MSRDTDTINAEHFGILSEIGNIGAGSAVTALSKVLGTKVDMKVPKVMLLEFKDTASVLGPAEELIFGIMVELSGDIDGLMMFLVKTEPAKILMRVLTQAEVVGEEFSEMELSALQEIGNILSSSYLNALSTLIGKSVVPSVPYLAKDMAGAILSVPTIEFGKIADKVLFIESVFGTDDENVSGYFILVPDLRSFNVISAGLGVI